MIDEQQQPTDASNSEIVEATEFKVSPEALAAAEEALEDIKSRSFSNRHPELGKMIKCAVCLRRHRASQICKQVFKQLWVDEDIDTGELSIQYATVPLPGQKGTVKAIVGAAQVAKKRKNRRPSQTGLQIVEITRQLMQYVNKERFPNEQAQMLEAKRMAINTFRNRQEKEAKRIRRQQHESRKINRS